MHITNVHAAIDPQKDGTLSIEQLIEPYMQKEQLTPTIITTFSDQTDIRNKIFRYSDYKNEPTFPTVLFIDTDHGETVAESIIRAPDNAIY